MKAKHGLSIITVSFLLVTIICIFSAGKTPKNIAAKNTQTPTTYLINPPTANTYPCINKYMPIIDDSTRVYKSTTTTADSTNTSTNYESLIYFAGKNYFSVNTRLGSKVGPVNSEIWMCTNYGFIRSSFESGDFSYFFKDKNGNINYIATNDWCPVEGVTLPLNINTGDTWQQEIDFEFTSSNLSGSGRFIYNYKAAQIEQVIVPAGTYDAVRIDVTAKGYIDPSRGFSPIFEGGKCRRNSNEIDQVNPSMSLSFRGSTWWAPKIGWVKKVGKVSNSQNVVESYEMELESIETP